MTYIAIGVFGWGKGRTAQIAKRHLRENVSYDNRNKYVIYSCTDENATVNHMGAIIARTAPQEVERKNWPE